MPDGSGSGRWTESVTGNASKDAATIHLERNWSKLDAACVRMKSSRRRVELSRPNTGRSCTPTRHTAQMERFSSYRYHFDSVRYICLYGTHPRVTQQGTKGVPKIIIYDTLDLFFLNCNQHFGSLISNRNSFRVLFDKIDSVYFS